MSPNKPMLGPVVPEIAWWYCEKDITSEFLLLSLDHDVSNSIENHNAKSNTGS